MVWIPAGRFLMGDAEGEADERPVHAVVFPEGFWMGRYEVTQEQFVAVVGSNPSAFLSPKHPVETVDLLEDVKAFMNGLARSGSVPPGYLPRLPTEAEWEYACRAGASDEAALHASLDDVAWYGDNSEGRTHPVGGKAANAFGLHDMLGNVWEWCSDWYMETFYEISTQQNAPAGPTAGATKVVRGGSWSNASDYCRPANRSRYRPWSTDHTVGFRLVLQRR